ncbi:MAG: GTP pyrophosphokinase family protein [Ruminococcaceae bacterium]|nr:GTP pyrophosphokinase family protein [Oscillospiraceae bacterium]
MENENSLQKEIELYLEEEDIDKEKIRNFFETKIADISKTRLYEFTKLMAYYRCAMMEVETKLNVLNVEFSLQHDRNPINDIKTRLKSFKSIKEKLERQNLPFNLSSIESNLHDIAGVRVVCSFPDDVYMLADALLKQDDITLVSKKDYIENPKPNGYRSLHMIITVPIFLAHEKKLMKVEIQLRTIAMDVWASLEHQLRYKKNAKFTKEMADELLYCAKISAELDEKMDKLRSLTQP